MVYDQNIQLVESSQGNDYLYDVSCMQKAGSLSKRKNSGGSKSLRKSQNLSRSSFKDSVPSVKQSQGPKPPSKANQERRSCNPSMQGGKKTTKQDKIKKVAGLIENAQIRSNKKEVVT